MARGDDQSATYAGEQDAEQDLVDEDAQQDSEQDLTDDEDFASGGGFSDDGYDA